MVRLLLKLGVDPNSTGTENEENPNPALTRTRGATPLDSCIFGLSIIPPEYGRNATALNRLEKFEDHFKCILYLVAAGANPLKAMSARLNGGLFYQLFDQTLKFLSKKKNSK